MKKKLLYIISSIYRDIVYSGIQEGISKDSRSKSIRFNQFILLALSINFLSVIAYFYNGLYISALINITSAYFFLVAYYFNAKRKLEIGRIVAVINVNIYLIIISYVEGLRAGEYLLYFPYFLALTFVVGIRKNFKELIWVFTITVISLIICVKVNPVVNDIQIMNDALYARLYNTLLTISLFLTIIFSYVILQVNRENEIALLQEKNFADTIYNTSLDAVFIIYSNSNIIASCNYRAVELFEVNEKREIEGSDLANWLTEDHIRRFHSIEKTGSLESQNWQGELTLTTKNGKIFYGYVSVVPFLHKQTGYLKISILDISDVKMAEFGLIKAKEKAEAAVRIKSRFLSNMSHELRTPLNGIIGASHLLIQEPYLPEQKFHFDILKYSSEHMMVLINDILDYNKMEAGKVQLAEVPFNMKGFLEKIITQFSTQITEKKLDFITDIDDQLDIEFITDETRLYQILGNLLSNAVKFTHEGSITLAAKKLFTSSTKATVQFTVKDTGIGIPLNKHTQVFESFTQADVNTTRKYGGFGLGLSIIKKLIEMFNSELVLTSQEGKGTEFSFHVELRINQQRKLYINEEKAKQLESLKGVRILIAEDNPVNLSIAKRFLNRWGIIVTEATNGKEALNEFKKQEFDLLLIDLEMPEMDGATAIQEIRKIDNNIPAVAFTAAVYDNMQIDLIQKGFTDFIHKPFRPEDLHSKIANLTTNMRV